VPWRGTAGAYRLAVATAVILIVLLLGALLPVARSSSSREPGAAPAVLTGSSLGTRPPFLDRLAMADDPADGYVLAFGGENPAGDPTNYTLAYRDDSWTNLTLSVGAAPPARWGASAFYDPTSSEVVLFGGCQTPSCYPALDDTWTFSSGAWHDISSTAGAPPSGRGFAAATWDGAADYGLLYGGVAGTVSSVREFADTWEFYDNQWANLTPTFSGASPPAREQASLASLPSGPAVLFGGRNNDTLYSDTWEFAAGAWMNLTATAGTAPPSRSLAMFAADPADGYLLLFGGSSNGYLRDGWTFAGGTWASRGTGPPPALYGAGLAYDADDGYVLLYGGAISQGGQTGITNGYWSYLNGSWHLLNPVPPAPIDWLIPGLLGGLTALFVGEAIFIHRRQDRHLGELSKLMPEPVGPVRWVPTAPPSVARWNLRRMELVAAGLGVPIFALIAVTTLASAAPGGLDNAIVSLASYVVFFGGVMSAFVWMRAQMETVGIGVADGGVVWRRKRSEVRIPWEYLQPPTSNPKGPWVYFPFVVTGRQGMPRSFGTTHDQARTILAHPRAQAWTIAPPIREALGLPMVPPTGMPPGPAVAPPTFAYPPPTARPAPLPSGPIPSAVGAGAQVRRCPRCSTFNTMRAKFCTRCGQPLVA